jgi:hypothetical protein
MTTGIKAVFCKENSPPPPPPVDFSMDSGPFLKDILDPLPSNAAFPFHAPSPPPPLLSAQPTSCSFSPKVHSVAAQALSSNALPLCQTTSNIFTLRPCPPNCSCKGAKKTQNPSNTEASAPFSNLKRERPSSLFSYKPERGPQRPATTSKTPYSSFYEFPAPPPISPPPRLNATYPPPHTPSIFMPKIDDEELSSLSSTDPLQKEIPIKKMRIEQRENLMELKNGLHKLSQETHLKKGTLVRLQEIANKLSANSKSIFKSYVSKSTIDQNKISTLEKQNGDYKKQIKELKLQIKKQ